MRWAEQSESVLLTAMVESIFSCSLRIFSPSFSFSSAFPSRVWRMTCGITHMSNTDAQQTKRSLHVVPADLQILFHLSQRLHFVLSMASLQQTVTTHIQPLINAVVAQYLCVRWAPALGEVPKWVHQQVGAERLSLQMGLEVFGTQ